jgi:hypothetical protein
MLIFCKTIILWVEIFIPDDGLMTDIFDDYLYIMRCYVYFGV